MDESIHLKPTVTLSSGDPLKGVFLRIPCLVFLAVLVSMALPNFAISQSSSCTGIHVKVSNIKHSKGNIACVLFDSPEGFPVKFLRCATKIMAMKIQDEEARFDFLSIPHGTYAIAVVHDENMNGELDTNWLGVPAEGYGFSTGAEAVLSAPSFSEASFAYDGDDMQMTIRLHY